MSSPLFTRIRKALARGESRFGLLFGSLAAIVLAALFAARTPALVERIDLEAVDYFFQLRPDRGPSGEIVMIYFDDVAARQLKNVKRDDTAMVVRALSRLGAKMIALDVEYVTDFSRHPDFEGRFLLDQDTQFLARAIEGSGRTVIVFNFEKPLDPPDATLARKVVGGLKAALTASLERLPDLTEEERKRIEPVFPDLQQIAAEERVSEMLAAEPVLTFRGVRERLGLTVDDVDTHTFKDVLRPFHAARMMEVLGSKRVPLEVRDMPPGVLTMGMVKTTIPEIAEGLLSAGHGTTPDRDVDGVLRRAPLLIRTPHGPKIYMGLEAAAKVLEDDRHRTALVAEADAITVEQREREGGAVTRRIRLPLMRDGSMLADWSKGFSALSFARIWEADDWACARLAENLGRAVEKLGGVVPGERWEPLLRDLQALDQDLAPLAREGMLPPAQLAEIDRRGTDLARRVIGELRDCVARQTATAAGKPEHVRKVILDGAKTSETLAAELEGKLDLDDNVRKRVAGKICFVGSKSTGVGDLYSTSMGIQTPGVDLHANVAAMVLEGRTLRYARPSFNFAYIAALGMAVAWAVGAWTLLRGSLFTAGVIAGSVALFFGIGTQGSVLISGAGPVVCSIVTFTICVSWRELVARRSQRRLQKELERHTSASLVSIIMADPERFSRPRKTTATIFFSDVKGFTSISEKMDAEQLVHFMNRYHDRMTQILKDRQAYLDKYIGDGIMALFGVPVETPDHARQGCRAALENVRAARHLSREFESEGLPPISIRVGLNSGEIVAAYVGASDRADYTAIGDAVNLAARLEGANKEYGTPIMVSESTYALAQEGFWFRELDLIRVVGKKQGIRVYELLAQRGEPSPLPEEFLAAYHDGMDAYVQREWSRAKSSFEKAVAIVPGDVPTELYIERCGDFVKQPPAKDWDGVFDLTSK